MSATWTADPGVDWDDEYANGPYIADGDSYPQRWASRAVAYRAELGGRADIGGVYGGDGGDGSVEQHRVLDVFEPEAAPCGLMVFVHGGYWLKFDPSYWSYLAQGAISHGWAVAMPGYVKAPVARLADIARQVAVAVETAAERFVGPIALAGHSAGGQIVTRLVSGPGLLSPAVGERVTSVVSISGVHDLRPLMATAMNTDLRLDGDEAARESPALLDPPAGDVAVACWVGGRERPEFLRQSRLLVEAWSVGGRTVDLRVEPERHHFDIIDLLAVPDSAMTSALVGRAATGQIGPNSRTK